VNRPFSAYTFGELYTTRGSDMPPTIVDTAEAAMINPPRLFTIVSC
jgi:hypothetical protein